MKRLPLALLSMLVLVACGVPNAPASPATAQARTTPQATSVSAGLDIQSLDACALMPRADIESVLGTLGKEPKADPPNGSEKGCIYYDQQGEYADITLNPASDWTLLRQLQPDATDFTLDGDKAFSADKSYGAELWVLRPGKAVIHVRVSSKDLEQAKRFVPTVIARLP